jgi:hypothetical protein
MEEREPKPSVESELVIECPDDPDVPIFPCLGELSISVEAEQPSDDPWDIADLGIPRDQA